MPLQVVAATYIHIHIHILKRTHIHIHILRRTDTDRKTQTTDIHIQTHRRIQTYTDTQRHKSTDTHTDTDTHIQVLDIRQAYRRPHAMCNTRPMSSMSMTARGDKTATDGSPSPNWPWASLRKRDTRGATEVWGRGVLFDGIRGGNRKICEWRRTGKERGGRGSWLHMRGNRTRGEFRDAIFTFPSRTVCHVVYAPAHANRHKRFVQSLLMQLDQLKKDPESNGYSNHHPPPRMILRPDRGVLCRSDGVLCRPDVTQI